MIARRLAEAVVLAREEQVRVRDAALEQRVDDPLRLARRHDPVLGALVDEHRRGDLLGVERGDRSR